MTEKNFCVEGFPMCTDFSTTVLSGAGLSGSSSATVTPTLNDLIYTYVPYMGVRTYTTLKCHVTTVGGSSNVIRMGMYSVDPSTGKPKDLILDAGTVSVTSGTGEKTIAISQLYRGHFYLAYVSQVGSAAIFRGSASLNGAVGSSFYGRPVTVSTTTAYGGFSESGVSGALPSSAGSLGLVTSAPVAVVIY